MNTHRIELFVSKHWFLLFSLGYGLFVGFPFIAPILMEIGLTWIANGIYFFYSFLCHQLPQRSFFLFGEKFMYSLSEIQDVWQATNNPLVLKRFIGNPEMGWKVAWSDRMVSMYSSILIVSWVWYPFRKKLSSLPIWGLILFLVPMALDGITHTISDFAGIGFGFRDSNLWLARMTNYSFSSDFYAGDAIGSFNSFMRLISGISFGLGIVLYGFPYIYESINHNIIQSAENPNGLN